MYTVLRFKQLSDSELQSLGRQMEKILPGVFTGPDRGCRDRVSIPLAEDSKWEIHVESIMRKIGLLDELIATMPPQNRTIELDIAIEPEDYESLLTEFEFHTALLDFLVSRGVVLKASIYGPV